MAHEHILVLEDHAELREQTRQILSGAGYEVQVASTGAEAVAAARETAFDLLMADIYLPGMSGIDAFKEIRKTRPDVAGIVVTGYSTWETAMDALHVGFVGFIVKPFVPEQLVAAVVNALEQEKLRRENARLRALVPLYELSRAFMGTLELKDVLDQIIATALQETKAEAVSLMLFDEDRRELRIAAASGLPEEVVETQKTLLGRGIAGRVAERGEALIINEGGPLDRYGNPRNRRPSRNSLCPFLAAPIARSNHRRPQSLPPARQGAVHAGGSRTGDRARQPGGYFH
ncbi:MAG: response regulator [Chloroflexi bacterium]|nr:response regulator [Chloroflexota bacterium]